MFFLGLWAAQFFSPWLLWRWSWFWGLLAQSLVKDFRVKQSSAPST